ncbi:type III pantothenate kinase [Flavobacterium orientale]|uniref:Type III pantothenate kinase n=1 Tax=Flavobacterium orientale TaxID=1756020 RepID=A0A916XXN5_9FLAO|nr:type III pantothenate kinase [Flavobacterium orientale]GGD19919.1 type III pantothenate kinase [Flavobacterium orientale]
MLLVIDIGNTRIKAAVFEQYTLLDFVVSERIEVQNDIDFFLKNFKIDSVILSSVSNFEYKKLFFPESIKVVIVDNSSKMPFSNFYKTPKTLGIDRMVLAAGAVLQFPKKNRLVIDAGTCITYDFIDENDNYFGGAISPGLKLRYEALNNYTANLPLLRLESPEKVIGNSTNSAIHSGVVNGVIYEIDGFITNFINQNKNFTIILTGGDTDFLAKRLKSTIFANSNFLLESLAHLYQYTK